MSFTIEDMMLTSEKRYEMKFLAGKNGWANSISWVHLLEDTTIIQNFWGAVGGAPVRHDKGFQYPCLCAGQYG